MFNFNFINTFLASQTNNTPSNTSPFPYDPVKLLQGSDGSFGRERIVTKIKDIDRISNMSALVGFVFNIIMGIGVAVVFVNIAIAFVNYVNESGDPKNLEKANKHLFISLIAFIIILVAWIIRTVFISTIGLGEIDVIDTGGGGGLPGGSSCTNGIDCASGVCRAGQCTL